MPIKINRHPGAVLREDFHLKTRRKNSELARAIGMSAHKVGMVLREEAPISRKMAEGLAKEFNTTVEFWTDLQDNYRMFTRM